MRLGLLAVGACVCVIVGSLALRTRSAVTRSAFDAVVDGMTRSDVEAIFGEVPSHISRSGRVWRFLGNGTVLEGHSCIGWAGDDGAATVVFDAEGRVISKQWEDSPRSLIQILRDGMPWLPF